LYFKSRLSEYQSRVGVVPFCPDATTPDFLASLASLAENIFRLSDGSSLDGKVVSINEATNPSIFCVLCGKT
jgi:hypothetical protein